MRQRFTIDGSDALEIHLVRVCADVLSGVQSLIPSRKLEAVVLGGGYGRGEGGVLRTEQRELPYNDLDFYVFVRGNEFLSAQRFHQALNQLGQRLSPSAGLHVEFKVQSVERLRASAITMFSYDLVVAHQLIYGRTDLFKGCEHHRDPTKIPSEEATRLLFNRCSGLLLAKELLCHRSLSEDEADFIGRNLAKAQLALGDALLTAQGQYHWSVLERQRRRIEVQSKIQSPKSYSNAGFSTLDFGLWTLDSDETLGFSELCRHHSVGVEFKLHPKRNQKSPEAFADEHAKVSAAAQRLWLWLESHRLERQFNSAQQYAFSPERKCNHSSVGRNFFLTLRTFGLRAVLDPMAWRYPRERLFNALNLLLWNRELSQPGEFRNETAALTRFVQRQLQTRASEWSELVAAYKQIWPTYG